MYNFWMHHFLHSDSVSISLSISIKVNDAHCPRAYHAEKLQQVALYAVENIAFKRADIWSEQRVYCKIWA